ncbi:MAG: hypothetical protein AAF922_06945 [Pseudomonadota bacterium]
MIVFPARFKRMLEEERYSGDSTDLIVQVPDPNQQAGIDLMRSAFVNRSTILTFSLETLQEVDFRKPRKVAVAALPPVRILDAAFKRTGNTIRGLVGLQ